MHGMGSSADRWTRPEKLRLCSGEEVNGGYLQLIRIMSGVEDPEVALVRGVVTKDGEGALLPLLILGEDYADLRPGGSGDYYIVLLDDEGEVVESYGFNASFELAEPEATVETDATFFVYRIEWADGVRSVELRDRDGRVLASRPVSPHAPEVEIVYPNGGEEIAIGQAVKIRWEASDEDGDELAYFLAMSSDGENWLPIASDVEDSEYELNTTGIEAGSYLIKVVATDGVNTAEDVSDAPFSLVFSKSEEVPRGGEVEVRAPPWRAPEFATLGILAAVVVGALVAYAVASRRRRR